MLNPLAVNFPGPKLTKSIQDNQELNKSILAKIPVKRWGTTEDFWVPFKIMLLYYQNYSGRMDLIKIITK